MAGRASCSIHFVRLQNYYFIMLLNILDSCCSQRKKKKTSCIIAKITCTGTQECWIFFIFELTMIFDVEPDEESFFIHCIQVWFRPCWNVFSAAMCVHYQLINRSGGCGVVWVWK